MGTHRMGTHRGDPVSVTCLGTFCVHTVCTKITVHVKDPVKRFHVHLFIKEGLTVTAGGADTSVFSTGSKITHID